MTPGDIKALVREAGWTGIYTQWTEPTGEPNWKPAKYSLTVPVTDEQLQRFVELVETRAKAEQRAASARLVRQTTEWRSPGWVSTVCPITKEAMAQAILNQVST